MSVVFQLPDAATTAPHADDVAASPAAEQAPVDSGASGGQQQNDSCTKADVSGSSGTAQATTGQSPKLSYVPLRWYLMCCLTRTLSNMS